VTSELERNMETVTQWRLALVSDKEAIAAYEIALEDFIPALLTFQVDEDKGIWSLEGIGEGEAPADLIKTLLTNTAEGLGCECPDYTLEELEQKDWLRENLSSFAPLSVGRFFVHGCHVEAPSRSGHVSILVDAATAFGSGEHPTTMGCLLALDAFKRWGGRPKNILDMGCGSGILSIGAVKVWPSKATAIDIDPESVRVTKYNMERNQVRERMQAEAGNGYKSPLARQNAPYDLILANILAKPLMRMAPDLKRNLLPGGYAILSGLLTWQEPMVMAAHRAQGLRKVATFRHKGWSTLVLQRGKNAEGAISRRVGFPSFTPRVEKPF